MLTCRVARAVIAAYTAATLQHSKMGLNTSRGGYGYLSDRTGDIPFLRGLTFLRYSYYQMT